MKPRIWTLLLIFTMLLSSVFSTPLSAAAPNIASPAAYLLDYYTGQVLYTHNENKPHAPASITKVMTLYVIFDALKAGEITLDRICYVSERAQETDGSSMWVSQGERVVFEEVIRGIAIASGNDATVVAAENITGSVEAFVERMNTKAKELGLTETHYVNTHGLDEPGHISTARDIATLGYCLLRDHPEVLQYTSMSEMTHAGVELFSRNQLLNTYPGADGIKTGSTDDAGYCLMATAERDGVRLISVVLGSDTEEMRNIESTLLLNYGFSSEFERTVILKQGDIIETKLNVRRARLDQIKLEVAEDVRVVVSKNMQGELEQNIAIPEQMDAPIAKGDQVGTLTISYQGQELTTVPVLAAEDSGEAGFFKSLWQSIVEFFSGLFRIV